MPLSNIDVNAPTAGVLRRLAALSYDAFLLFAVLLLASFPFMKLLGNPAEGGVLRFVFQLYLGVIGYLFFCWFWTHGGQTLGMRAWRMRLVSDAAGPITWRQASLRFIGALVSAGALGLGYAVSAVRKDKLAWHDRFSLTHPVVEPKKSDGGARPR